MNTLQDFDPNGPGLRNGNFIGLPFDETSAQTLLLPIPWDVTTSYAAGTAYTPERIREASLQLDLYDKTHPTAWKKGIFMLPASQKLLQQNEALRPQAERIIEQLEYEQPIDLEALNRINEVCEKLHHEVYLKTKYWLKKGKKIGLIGGDHSTPLGYINALADQYNDFGILQIDAHCDLRNAYEGFTYSHASIMYNALDNQQVTKLVQIGIRDYCEAEYQYIEQSEGRVLAFFDEDIKAQQFEGITFAQITKNIIEALPKNVYISFDIDGLQPAFCPNTGTPVPGGLTYEQAIFLLKKLHDYDKKIIGFDVCETGNAEWDANVAARVIYQLCLLMNAQS